MKTLGVLRTGFDDTLVNFGVEVRHFLRLSTSCSLEMVWASSGGCRQSEFENKSLSLSLSLSLV